MKEGTQSIRKQEAAQSIPEQEARTINSKTGGCTVILEIQTGDLNKLLTGIRRGQKEYPPASLQLDVI